MMAAVGAMDPDPEIHLGLLAYQLGFVGADALVAAVRAWTAERHATEGRRLVEVLVARHALAPERRDLLAALADEHLQIHGGDQASALDALAGVDFVRAKIECIVRPNIGSTLAEAPPAVSSNDKSTSPVILGAPTSVGGRFRILRPHAKGGLGEVFVAHDGELNREVAVKQIQPHVDAADNRARFVLEAEITGGLEHPGVVPVYGLGADANGRPFYVMRFIKGESLKEAIATFHGGRERGTGEQEGRWPQDQRPKTHVQRPSNSNPPSFASLEFRQLLRRFIDVCNAVEYAHSRGILHRDLKPENVMLGAFGETLVVDFGGLPSRF
jgi:serine/threonine-protein kinase